MKLAERGIVFAAAAVVAAATTAGAAPGTHAATRAAPAAAGRPGHAALAALGRQLWARHFPNGNSEGFDAVELAVGPRGNRAFVTGDAGTVAYDGTTGTRVWSAAPNPVAPSAIAVSPDGKTVFVTGAGPGSATATDYATVAYDAATGTQRWASFHFGPSNRGDQATAVTVSPDGRTVYVTGDSADPAGGQSAETVAYDAATGAQLWDARYSNATFSEVFAMALSPDGKMLYITGSSTVAYAAATGQLVWARPGNGGVLGARALAVSPDGATLLVAGAGSPTGGAVSVTTTVAYQAGTGAQRWIARYHSPASGTGDMATAITVSPGGGRAYVTAISTGRATGQDYATIAYRISGGSRVWAKRYSSSGNNDDQPNALVVSPGGGTVFVTGESAGGYGTIAYRASDGAWLGGRFYHAPHQPGQAYAVQVSSDGKLVFVTGQTLSTRFGMAYTTIAYRS